MSDRLLKTALLSNSAFSVVSGVVLLAAGAYFADRIGPGVPWVYRSVGAGLVAFAGYVSWVATRKHVDTFEALQISAGDVLWVLATIVLIGLAWNALTATGIVTLLAVDGIVLAFAFFQLKGIAHCYAVPGEPGLYNICVEIDTPAPADSMWRIVADLEDIENYSPRLVRATLRDGATSGFGAVRECTDTTGSRWAEHCTRYDHEARALDLQFLTEEPGFPYPFRILTGGWQVMERPGGSIIRIHFELSPNHILSAPVVLALMARRLPRDFGEIVASMSQAARGEAVRSEVHPRQQGIFSRLTPC